MSNNSVLTEGEFANAGDELAYWLAARRDALATPSPNYFAKHYCIPVKKSAIPHQIREADDEYVYVMLTRKDSETKKPLVVQVESVALIKTFEDSLRASFALEGVTVNDDTWVQMLRAKEKLKSSGQKNYFILDKD